MSLKKYQHFLSAVYNSLFIDFLCVPAPGYEVQI